MATEAEVVVASCHDEDVDVYEDEDDHDAWTRFHGDAGAIWTHCGTLNAMKMSYKE